MGLIKEEYDLMENLYKLNSVEFIEFIIRNIEDVDKFENLINMIFEYNNGNNYIAEDIRKQRLRYDISDAYSRNILFSAKIYKNPQYYNILKEKSKCSMDTNMKFIEKYRDEFLKDLKFNLLSRNIVFSKMSSDDLFLCRNILTDDNITEIINDQYISIMDFFNMISAIEYHLEIDLQSKESIITDKYYKIFIDNNGNNYSYLKKFGGDISNIITDSENKNKTSSISLAKMFGIYFEEEELSKVKVRLKYFTTDALNRIAALSKFRRSVSKAMFNQIMENEKRD